VAKMLASGKVRRAEQELVYESNISALEAAPAVPRAAHPEARRSPEDFLGDILQRTVGRRDFGRPPAAEPPAEGGLEEISALGKARSLWTLLKGKGGATPEDTEEWNRRLFDLRDALLAFQGPDSFDRTRETAKVYWDEAVVLGRSPIRHVVFGHTHLAKQVRLPKGGGYYFNSGTWADFLGVPREILDTSRKLLPLGKLEQFVHDLIDGNLSAYDIFHPTYVRFDQDGDGNSLAAALVDYQPGAFPL